MKQRRFEVLVLLMALVGSGVAAADEKAKLNEIVKVGAQSVKSGQASQQRVEKIAEDTDTKFQEYKGVAKQVRDLKIFNRQMEVQIERQEQRLKELDKAIEDASLMRRQMAPLTNRMLDALADFVELDIPFHKDEREKRIARLRANMKKDEFSIAEKFRQVLEAYSIELQYGKSMESFTGTIMLDGQEVKVDHLRVGRTAYMFQTFDTKTSGYWDNEARQWVVLEGSSARNAIRQGIKITRKQASVEVIRMPITAPKAAQ